MNTEPTTPVMTETIKTSCDGRFLPSLCWKAIIGGTVAAIGIHLLLTTLGVGAGLATFTPMTDANPATNFSVGAAIVWSICALIALAFGGFVAGRFSHSLHSGFAHGILVWSLTLIISLLLLTAGTGMVMGGALKVLGEGLGIGGKAVAAGAGDLAKEGVKRSSDQLGSFIDEAVQSVPTNAAPKAATRAKREIGFAVTKLFAPGNDIASPDNRTAVIKSLVDYAQMSEADATKTVDDWMTSYKNLKAELDNLKAMAEQKAREAADKAASNLSCAAMWSFFALLIGLLVTALAGRCGARCALRYADSPSAPPL
jgi:polyhydroxyalkanoate synthesis regulator phasin